MDIRNGGGIMPNYLTEMFLDTTEIKEDGIYHGNILVDLETGKQEQTLHKGTKEDCKEQSCIDEEE